MKNKFTLFFFAKGDGLTGSDFENKESKVTINLDLIVSISDLITFELPFSRKIVGKCAVVTMINNDKYYIKESIHHDLFKAIE